MLTTTPAAAGEGRPRNSSWAEASCSVSRLKRARRSTAIKEKLAEIHDRFLGETVSEGGEELEASYLLLVETWLDRMEAEDNNRAWSYPNEDCHFFLDEHWAEGGVAHSASDTNAMLYTWTTMLIYFMTDFYYLHE